jgi:hypothetical protein
MGIRLLLKNHSNSSGGRSFLVFLRLGFVPTFGMSSRIGPMSLINAAHQRGLSLASTNFLISVLKCSFSLSVLVCA